MQERPENFSEGDQENTRRTEAQKMGLVSTLEFAEGKTEEELEEIYSWYASAMSRRERWPLERERFFSHFFYGGSLEPTYIFGDKERGFLLGFLKHGIFIPTHFAPKSLRSGYELFKELGESKRTPVVTAVTPDVAETLKKIKGWRTLKLSLLAYFNSDLVKKMVVYNSSPGIRLKMLALVKEFIEETRRIRETQDEPDTDSQALEGE